MPYATEHLLKLAVAFELISLGLPAKTATDIVEAGWERLRCIFAAAAKDPLVHGSSRSGAIFAAIYCDFLKDSSADTVVITGEDENSLTNRHQVRDWSGSRLIVLNVSNLVLQLFDRIEKVGQLMAFLVYREVAAWKFTGDVGGFDHWYRIGEFDEEGVIRDRRPQT